MKSETLEQTIESFRKKTNAYEHNLIEEKQKYEKTSEEV